MMEFLSEQFRGSYHYAHFLPSDFIYMSLEIKLLKHNLSRGLYKNVKLL